MTSYSYYNSLPQWGTSQFQQMPPPAPQYQPTPSWSGADYFNAHSGNRDNSIFDYVWYKMRDFVLGTGFGRKQAFHWWKRIYSGLVDPSLTLPKEIGAAAGYEAIRLWETYSSVYASPLNADREREREALVGLAAAEATKLWNYTGRLSDKWGRLEASETAGATASRIFIHTYGYNSGRLNNISRSVVTNEANAESIFDLFARRSSSRRRASVSPFGRRPSTPYRAPSAFDTYSSPVSSFENDAFNMAGMGATLPNSPYLSAPVVGTPMRSPSPLSLGGMGQGYRPPPADDFPNDYDGYDDYEEPYDEYYNGYDNFGGTRRGGGGYGEMRSSGYRGMGPGNYGSMGLGDYRGRSPSGFGEMGSGDYAGMDGFGGMGSGGLGGFGNYGGSGFGSPSYSTGGFGGSTLGYGDPMLGEGQGYDMVGPMGYNNGVMATPSNVTYDPILGPGIKGTYYPKVAQMQQLSRSGYNNYPGASVGLPPPPSLNRAWSRGGLRRSRSFY